MNQIVKEMEKHNLIPEVNKPKNTLPKLDMTQDIIKKISYLKSCYTRT